MKKYAFIKKGITVTFLVLLVSVLLLHFNVEKAQAASKKTTWYVSSLSGFRSGRSFCGVDLRIKNNKLILKGYYRTGRTSNAASSKYLNYHSNVKKSKTKQLKLSPKVKIYGYGGDGERVRYSMKQFKKSFVGRRTGLLLMIKVVNNVVTEIDICS